jgi:hypothetical protein
MIAMLRPISDDAFNQLLRVMESLMLLSFSFKAALRKVLYECDYGREDRILNFGNTQLNVWFLLEGLLREIRMDKILLKEKTSWFWLPGSFVYTEPGFFSQQASARAIEAAVASRAVLISYTDWAALKAAFSEVDLITEMVRGGFNKLRIEHIEDTKSLSIEERYLDMEDTLDYLFPKTQLNFIADFMGMAPATLGRLRTKYYGRRR